MIRVDIFNMNIENKNAVRTDEYIEIALRSRKTLDHLLSDLMIGETDLEEELKRAEFDKDNVPDRFE
jgi:hypothetical protein